MTLNEAINFLASYEPTAMLRVGLINPHSYRGYYDQLAVEPGPEQAVADALAVLRPCIGRVFEGYKGGSFKMTEWTKLWFAHFGTTEDSGEITPMLLALLLGEPVAGDCKPWADDDWRRGEGRAAVGEQPERQR